MRHQRTLSSSGCIGWWSNDAVRHPKSLWLIPSGTARRTTQGLARHYWHRNRNWGESPSAHRPVRVRLPVNCTTLNCLVLLEFTSSEPPGLMSSRRRAFKGHVEKYKSSLPAKLSQTMSIRSALALAALAAVVQAQSLTVVNKCTESLFLYTQTSFGSIANNVNVAAGASANMGISSNWDGAINVGTGCSGSQCTTGGPTWDGNTPFSRAEFNFYAIPGSVTYDISLIYGYNVGMEISSADGSCDQFACTISSGCPVPGPDGSCFSPCCSSSSACSGGALPAGGGGCVNNAGPGPNSPFYYTTCPNAYAFPDNDGANGYQPADLVDYTCPNTDITLTLCPGWTSHL